MNLSQTFSNTYNTFIKPTFRLHTIESRRIGLMDGVLDHYAKEKAAKW